MFETLQNKMSDLEAGDLRGLCASNQPSCDHGLNGFEDLLRKNSTFKYLKTVCWYVCCISPNVSNSVQMQRINKFT